MVWRIWLKWGFWRLVAPNDSPGSPIDFGMVVMPKWVNRTAVGMTKMIVMIRPGALPRPNGVSTEIRLDEVFELFRRLTIAAEVFPSSTVRSSGTPGGPEFSGSV